MIDILKLKKVHLCMLLLLEGSTTIKYMIDLIEMIDQPLIILNGLVLHGLRHEDRTQATLALKDMAPQWTLREWTMVESVNIQANVEINRKFKLIVIIVIES